jgi:hypothetical protein
LVEFIILITLSAICFQNSLWIAGVLLLCLAVNLALLLILQYGTKFVFANALALARDILLTAANGAAIDAQVIERVWNATEMDVLVGYLSQLHALTNIPVVFKSGP